MRARRRLVSARNKYADTACGPVGVSWRAGVDAYRTVCMVPTAEVVGVFEVVERWAA
jgi:hypothetical protein